ncbi:hypothetical protein C8R45DRAFT_956358 [Mycena sanguinolenta]|nr:hypothetical protein C8R45DRAFT_956358 [Mycena sanguinolenta]
MILAEGDNKVVPPAPVNGAEVNGEPSRAPSPPPAYTPSTDSVAGGTTQILVQRQEPDSELSSAFRPPSPSSFPHPHPHTRMSTSGPTPLFMPVAVPFSPQASATEQSYPYYDPRSPYSLALADQRAWNRFRSAFLWNVAIFVLLWCLGLIRLDM